MATAKKISELERMSALSGTEELVIAYLGKNFRVTADDLLKIVKFPTKAELGIDQVDNTSDLDKPLSTAAQAALNEKSDITHTHTVAGIVGLRDVLDTKAAANHEHSAAQIVGLSDLFALKADKIHRHSIDQIDGLIEVLDNKAGIAHTHELNDVNGLITALLDKSDTGHTHAIAEIENLPQELESLSAAIAEKVSPETLAEVVLTLAAKSHRHDASEIDNLPDVSVTITAAEW